MIESLLRTIDWAEARLYGVTQIRVTLSAAEGGIYLVPLTLKQRIEIAPRPIEGGLVPDASTERLREILIHPADWLRVLSDPTVRNYVSGGVTGFCGIKVVNG